jgi:steroid delta-isomerase-like uncharacterized protein
MSEQNKATARRFYEAWNNDDFDVFDEILAPNYQDHDTQNAFAGTQGPEGPKQSANMYRAAFPDGRFEVQEQFADGDCVITRWTASGTHEGGLMGMPATGKHAEITGITIDRFEGGKIAEGWTNWDTLGMLQQLGAVPEAAARA